MNDRKTAVIASEVKHLFNQVTLGYALFDTTISNDRSNEAKWYAAHISRSTNTCVKETTVERVLRSIRRTLDLKGTQLKSQ